MNLRSSQLESLIVESNLSLLYEIYPTDIPLSSSSFPYFSLLIIIIIIIIVNIIMLYDDDDGGDEGGVERKIDVRKITKETEKRD